MNLTEEILTTTLGIVDTFYRYIGYKNILIKLDKREVDLDKVTESILSCLSKTKDMNILLQNVPKVKKQNIFYRLPCSNYYMNNEYNVIYIEIKHKLCHYIMPVVIMPYYGNIITLDEERTKNLTYSLKLPREKMFHLAKADIHIPDTFIITDDGIVPTVLPDNVIKWYHNIDVTESNGIKLRTRQPPIFTNSETGQKIYISPLAPTTLINDVFHGGHEVLQIEIYYNYNIYKYINLLNGGTENILSGYIFIPKDSSSGLEPLHYEIIGNGYNLYKIDLRELINTAM